MNKKLLLVFSILLLVPVGVQNAFATTWDTENDFAGVVPQVGQGPFDAWRYYNANTNDRDGVYTELSIINPGPGFLGTDCYTAAFPGVVLPFNNLINCGVRVAPADPDHDKDGFAPFIDSNVIVGFTAPIADTYHIVGLFRDISIQPIVGGAPDLQRGVLVTITTTTTPGVPGSDAAAPGVPWLDFHLDLSDNPGDGIPDEVNFDFFTNLAAGQELFFRVNDRGNGAFDPTFMPITITNNDMDTGGITTWIGTGNGKSWSDPNNWDRQVGITPTTNGFNHALPELCDLVIIDDGSKAVTVHFDISSYQLGNEMQIGSDDTLIIDSGSTFDHTPDQSCQPVNSFAETIVNLGNFNVLGTLLNNGAFINSGAVLDCGIISGTISIPGIVNECPVVGGEFIPIDSTALLLAGLQSSAIWMIPALAGAAGVSAFYIKTRLNKE